jgi:myo-inositol 2-dehydrogenase/D-chiro-inositol 1-dehydrogenase
MANKINVGVIGAGRIGKIHISNIVYYMPEARVKTVADANLTPEIERWAKDLGIPNVSKNAEDILRDPEISVVLICSSTDTHADYIIKAAQAGKNIFCEKPVDLTIEKVKAALAAVRKAGVRLQIGFNRRFDHNFAHIRELAKSGSVGQIQLVKITSRDPAPPPPAYVKVSGGIFLDMTIHDFDMARFQAGSEVEEVYAAGAVLVDPEIGAAGDVDTAIITLKFANGALGVIDNSRKAVYGYDQRVEVFGSGGALTAENDAPSQVRLSDANGVHGDKPLYFFLERYREAFVSEMKAFFEAIRAGTETQVTGNDGLMDLAIGLAAKKSLAEHRPVKISEVL